MRRNVVAPVRAAAAVGLVLLLVGGAVVWRAARAVHSVEQEARAEHHIRFTVRPLAPVPNSDFELISPPAVFFQAARFEDHLYLAGPAGLLEYNSAGTLVHEYAVGREFPGSPLLAVVPAVLADAHEPELVIASANDGIIAFNGRTFRQILPAAPDARAITTILPSASGHLLLGTKKKGVLIYDGKQIKALHPALNDVYVTALAGDETNLWVGTLDRGVLHFRAGQAEAFTEKQGLPDPQVHSLAVAGDTTYVGTSLGVAVFSSGQFVRVVAPGVLATALLATREQLYIGSEDQGVIRTSLAARRPNPGVPPALDLLEVRELLVDGDAVLAVARNGLYRAEPHGFGWKQVLQPGASVLSDGNISALAADTSGRLWIGYFDRGLDIVAPESRRAIHVEDEHVFCVNRIFPDTRSGSVNVATANGLVRFDAAGHQQQLLTRTDGLIADHVTDIAPYGGGLALATPAGLTLLDATGAHSMYAFHGLVNNHVYALAVSGDQLMAGTLGGLSLLDKGNVMVNYTTATSNLKHNWITAVVPVGPGWIVGTYGAGILGLDPSGRFRSFQTATGEFEVNPNAMLVTPRLVLAGSQGKGLYLYDRQLERWSVVTDGLPSRNVTALAAGNGYIYIGTDNGLIRILEQKLHL